LSDAQRRQVAGHPGADAATFHRMSSGQARPSWREAFTIDRPLPPTPATRRLRRLILLTAVATVVVDLVNLTYAEHDDTFGLAVRTF